MHTDKEGLKFMSEFESGNLAKATRMAPNEYELVMCNDYNTRPQAITAPSQALPMGIIDTPFGMWQRPHTVVLFPRRRCRPDPDLQIQHCELLQKRCLHVHIERTYFMNGFSS